MSLRNLISTIVIYFFTSGLACAGANEVKVYIYSDNISANKEFFRLFADQLFLTQKKSPLTEFAVFHMSPGTGFPETWQLNGKSAQYYPQKIDCSFDQCKSLDDFISSKKTGRTKLFISPGNFNCDILKLGIENAPFDGSITNVQQKIDEELLLNKKLGSDLCLIFYFPNSTGITSPSISIDKNSYELFEGDEINLILNTENVSTVQWTPDKGLSCTDCINPTAKPVETIDYEVFGSNKLGCKTEKLTVHVEVKKKCAGYDATKILYHIDNELYRKVLGSSNRYLLASDQPGSKIYYLICSTNCCSEFNLIISTEQGQKIWQQDYYLEQIVDNPKLGEDHPDKFIFKVDLEDIQDFDSHAFYSFQIKCIDEDSDKYKLYNSPPTKFVDCGFTE